MNNMTLSIDHDVPVMAILDLQNVAYYGISGHGLYKVEAGLLKFDRVFSTIFRDEEIKQIVDLRSPHLITRRRVRHDIDHTTLSNIDQ